MTDADVHAGQCHCGSVKFTVRLADGFNTIRRCTCSYCRMRGAVAVSADIGGITFLEGEDVLTHYRFNTGWSCSMGSITPRIMKVRRGVRGFCGLKLRSSEESSFSEEKEAKRLLRRFAVSSG